MDIPHKSPSFTVVLAVQDQADALQSELPRLLVQQYDDFQVVVVDESSVDSTSDVLSSLREEYARLYSTFVPKYHFQRNPRRLAFTIGMKAAKGEWVVFADINSLPPSETWLSELAEFAVESNILLLGYVKRKTGDVQLKPYEDLNQARSIISRTERRRMTGGSRLMGGLRRDYDFIAVRADQGHELLRMFESSKQRRL